MVSPLTAFDCATDDPTGVGELTGAWAGSGGGTYYIRQVGDCVWWFGTELRNVVPGATGQPGFANAAVGRLDGPHLELEYVDLPLGDVLGGGGLSWIYVDGNELLLTDQRRNWQPIWRYRANAYRGAAESECDVAVT